MRRTFITNLILLVLLNLLVKPFYILGVEAEIQNRVGADVYGSYFALINFSFLLNIILDVGITNWNTRHIAQNPQVISKHFGPLIALRIILAVIYMIIAGVTGLVLGYARHELIILLILAAGQVFASGILFLRSNLTGLHLFKHDSFISILDRIILITAMSYLLWMRNVPFKMEWLVYGQCVAYFLTFIIALLFVTTKASNWKLKFNLIFSKIIIRESLPYAGLILISSIAYRADSILVERISGPHNAGIYAMGFRFFEAVNMMAYLFAVLLLPLFAGMIKRRENINKLLGLSFKMMLTAASVMAIACMLWSENILSLFYDHNIETAAPSFAFLMIGCAAFCIQYVTGTLLTAAGKMRILIIIATAGMLLNLTLNLILIPRIAHLGAAYAGAITQVAIMLVQIVIIGKEFKPDWNRDLLRASVFVAISVALGKMFASGAIIDLGFPYAISLFAICSVICAWIAGMFSFRSLGELIQSKTGR